METEIRYYQLPLTTIPFSKIPSLENIEFKTVVCSEFYYPDKDGAWLISVFNAFDYNKNDLLYLQKLPLLYGTVLSQTLPKRGVNKCVLINKGIQKLEFSDLPHLRYTSKVEDSPEGNWFYTKDGKYYIFAAIETEYEKAKHLESLAIYGDWVLRLRIVMELLKKNIKDGKITLTIDQIKKIAFEVLKNEPSLNRLNDEEIMDGVNNWVPPMMFTPLIEDIPENIRGKINVLS